MLMKIKRYREILTILSKYGLAGWISRINVDFIKDIYDRRAGKNITHLSSEERIRLAITELGPTFIKLGQILSTRADLIGLELAQELKSLQSNIPADPKESVRETIETELGKTIEDLFDDFQMDPIGSASIGQVHLARLKNGQEVVVKVQHKGIEGKISLDLEILLDIAELTERYIEESRNYRPLQTCEEFKRLLLRELDFRWEKRNLKQFESNFSEDPSVHVPCAFDEFCSSRVLTIEKIEGIALSNLQDLTDKGYNLSELAKIGAHTFLKMIFEHGFYHADPHPGNIFAMDHKKIGLIDCGMVGRLDDELREDIEDLLISIVRRNGKKLMWILSRISSFPRDIDRKSLQVEITEFVEFYGSLPLKELNLSKALQEITSIIRRYKVTLPSRISLLIKVLVMLEGTSRDLSPDFDLISILEPYKSKMILRRLSPSRAKRAMENFYQDMEKFMQVVPCAVADIVENFQTGNFAIQLQSDRLDNVVNRMVYGILTSALFLGSTLLLSTKTPPLLGGVSALGIIGYIISTLFGVRLLWAIHVSGNLNR